MNNLQSYHLIGITGIIGAGKSYLAQYIQNKYHANIIEIDTIRRDMLWVSLSLEAISLRQDIIHNFSINEYDQHFFFNREKFTTFIFSDKEILNRFNFLCFNYFKNHIMKNVLSDKLNCIVWVNLIEDNYHTLVEHIVFVDILEDKWLNNNKDNLLLLKKRQLTQLNKQTKKQLLTSLSISYEVFLND